MHTKDLVFYYRADWKIVEKLCKLVPELYAVNPLAAVVESVGPVDRFALVITAQKKKVFGVFNLEGQEQTNCCDRKMSSVHIVSQEQIVGIWWVASAVEMV